MIKNRAVLYLCGLILLLSACAQKIPEGYVSVIFRNGWPVFAHDEGWVGKTEISSNYERTNNPNQLYAYVASLFPLDVSVEKVTKELRLSVYSKAGFIPFDYPYKGVFNGLYDYGCFLATYEQVEAIRGKTVCDCALRIDYVMDPRYVDKIIELEIDPYSVNGDYYVSKRALEIFPDVYEIPQVEVMIPDPSGK